MLVERTALVTGASSGIGEACARQLARAGARVIVTARRRDRLEALAAELDGPIHPLELDVSDHHAVQRALDELPTEWRDIDLLVNNAGLAGAMSVAAAVLPGMVERGRGDVIMIGSIAGREAYPGGAAYCASKAAVHQLTDALRGDLHGTGVRLCLVEPGMVETEFSLVRFGGDADRAAAVYQDTTPLTADDVADVITWIVDRPDHVEVADVLVMPTAQSAATRVERRR
ncbi:MAG: NAD(P)-dependent oxidoreductase [Actinobacteria bacterium QS_5_72_10]|nr:MAG: NAD(P)-dependent oxidoreductase [Actinobacteria bacterium QS_5_72_10]